MNNFTRTWLQGYACAVGTLARMEGFSHSKYWPTQVKELAEAGGLTLEKCREAQVDQFDIDALWPEKAQND